MSGDDNNIEYGPTLKVADLDKSRPREIDFTLSESAANALADELGIDAVRKVRLKGKLSPLGKRDWRFTGHVGATVAQESVISLDPITTRIEEEVTRTWIADWEPVTAEESETPEDVDQEPLGTRIDFGVVLAEAVALSLPDYPRREDDALEENSFSAPGTTPMSDEDTKPFAGLAALRDKLAKDQSNDE